VLSIIIPTCNRNDLLDKCLDCLHYDVQQLNKNLYEVIVSDDGKNSEAKQLIEQNHSWVKWVEGPKRGPAANRNNGAKYAQGEWLIFLDDDVLPNNTLLKSYINAVKSNFGSIVFEGSTRADRERKRLDEESPVNESGGCLWSCNFMIEKDFFLTKLNGFDEGFPYAAAEDTDLNIRIRKLTKVLFLKEAVVIHPWRRIKPFSRIKKHIASIKYLNNKHGLNISAKHKINRIKYFLIAFIRLSTDLFRYSFRGFPTYIEQNIINFSLIFI